MTVAKLEVIEKKLKVDFASKKPSDLPAFISSTRIFGSTSTVYIDPIGRKRFYKVFDRKLLEFGMSELKNLIFLEGVSGIPKIVDWGKFRGPKGDQLWILMDGIENAESIELVKDGNLVLSDIWKDFTFSQRIYILSKVARILDHAHQWGISHNDVKPLNIIINAKGEVMVIYKFQR